MDSFLIYSLNFKIKAAYYINSDYFGFIFPGAGESMTDLELKELLSLTDPAALRELYDRRQ